MSERPSLVQSELERSGRVVASESSERFQTGAQRYERPVYDYPVKYSPCRAGCPAGHDIAWALFFAARRRPDLALHTFKEESPFPAITGRICYHPCEPVCNRGSHDQPIAIHALERAFAERGRSVSPPAPLTPVYAEPIGIIGAGPAGLAAAYHLLRLGYPVTVYDAHPEPGGMLAYGIPPYRLPREVLRREIDDLRSLGMVFRCNTRIGRDLGWEELQARHPALFLAVGLGRARQPDPPLPDHAGVLAGIDFLQAVRLRQAPALHGEALVIGGGDVAIDVARSARRLGAEKVTLCALEAHDRMPAHPDEIRAALQEGVEVRHQVGLLTAQAGPDGLRARFGRVVAMDRGDDGTVAFQLDPHTSEERRADFVFYAVGQRGDLSFLPGPLGRRERLQVDSFGRTSLPGLFAGGDITGTYNVVNAIGSAKRAVIGIDCSLRGWDPEQAEARIRLGSERVVSMRAYAQWRQGRLETLITTGVPFEAINPDYFPRAPRETPPELEPGSPARQETFQEVVRTYDEAALLREAERCFNCGICNMCGNCYNFCPDAAIVQRQDWSFDIDLVHCKGCGVCVEECPRGAMVMIPEREVTP